MILITASFNLSWPEQVTSLFASVSPISESSSSVFSFDCFMDPNVSDPKPPGYFTSDNILAPDKEFRIVFQKLLMFALIPFFIALVSLVVWSIILKRRNAMEHLETRFISSLVIIVFLIHPTITQYMIDMFNCLDFDGDLRLMGDLQVVCWTGMHWYMTYFCALPCIFLWGLGIPAATWVLMNNEKERLTTVAAKEKFGFLYNGYKRETFYWEIVTMYRKIACIAVAVFLNRVGLVV